jgi:cytochrome bd ubiquinol oxidase subunit II
MPPELSFSLPTIVAGLMLLALILYALLAGADFGGGVLDMLASGPRAKAQRELIATAIGPVWEANHVWLIYVIVVLFTAFPPAFAALSTALHIPLTLMLIGIVLRGCAFTFRHYDAETDNVQRRWGRIFAMASVITPVLLGICIGAISTGGIRVQNGIVTSGFLRPWLELFPFAVGLFALALFTFLAAVYLTVEAEEEALREDFRRRALGAAIAVGVMAGFVFLFSGEAAPMVRKGLSERSWAWLLHAATGLFAVGAIFTLWTRKYALARLCSAAQVTLILVGWALAAYPYLVPPDLSIENAVAPPVTLRLVLGATIGGAILLVPSLYYLMRVFKGKQTD